MLYLLNPRVWIAALLAIVIGVTGIVSYRAGAKSVQAKWDAQKNEQVKARAELEAQYRAKEQQLVAAKQEAEVAYVELKNRFDRDAAGARRELDRLRSALAARQPAATPANPASIPKLDATPGIQGELLGECAQALVGLAAEADGLAAQLIGLQRYVAKVLLKASPEQPKNQ